MIQKILNSLNSAARIFFQGIKNFINSLIVSYYKYKVAAINGETRYKISEFTKYQKLYDELFGEGVYKPEEYIKGFGKYKRNNEDEATRENERLPRAYVERAKELFISIWIRYDLQARVLNPVTESAKKKMTRELMLLGEKYPEGNQGLVRFQNSLYNLLEKRKNWEENHYEERNGEFVAKEKYLELDKKLVFNLGELIGMTKEEMEQGKLVTDSDFEKKSPNQNFSNQTVFEELMTQNYSNNVEKGDSFEHYCATLLHKMGFIVEKVEGGANDRGIDIRISSDDVIKTKIAVQCKHYPDESSKISTDVIHKAMSAKQLPNESFDKIIVMTSGFFTSESIKLAEETGVGLFDYNEIKKLSSDLLGDMTLQEIDSFGSQFRKI